jgi:hypothetical protein
LRPILAIASFAAVLAFAANATANQTFHTLTAPLMSVDGSPLQSGWVHDIHTNGNNVGGHEVYHIAGATPNTTYQVVIQFYPNATCVTGTATPIPTATLTTNGAGAANGSHDFAASPKPPPAPVDDSAIWQLVGPNGISYATTCHLVIIGGK